MQVFNPLRDTHPAQSLAEVQDACWFTEFASHAATHRLQYLTDSLDGSFLAGELSGKTRAALAGMAKDRLRREQFIDNLIGRRFRASLLCRANREVKAERQTRALDSYGTWDGQPIEKIRPSKPLANTRPEMPRNEAADI